MAIHLPPLTGIPSVQPGDALGELLAQAIEENRVGTKPGDVLVVCQKIVSKAEGRVVARRVLAGLALGFVLGAPEIAILDDRDIVPRIAIFEFMVLNPTRSR